jgi:hypothetical protein
VEDTTGIFADTKTKLETWEAVVCISDVRIRHSYESHRNIELTYTIFSLFPNYGSLDARNQMLQYISLLDILFIPLENHTFDKNIVKSNEVETRIVIAKLATVCYQ